MINLYICDDQSIVRDGLELMLSLEDDFTVVGKGENGEQAVHYLQQHKVDLLLLDLNMPVLNGVQAAERILQHNPSQKILVLTTFDDEQWLAQAINAGVSGYLLKDSSREELVAAIRGTIAGKHYIDPAVAGNLLRQSPNSPANADWLDNLNEKEQKVLTLLASGLTNQQIADKLFMSTGTVKNYVSALLVKLDVQDRTQAAIKAVKAGLA